MGAAASASRIFWASSGPLAMDVQISQRGKLRVSVPVISSMTGWKSKPTLGQSGPGWTTACKA